MRCFPAHGNLPVQSAAGATNRHSSSSFISLPRRCSASSTACSAIVMKPRKSFRKPSTWCGAGRICTMERKADRRPGSFALREPGHRPAEAAEPSGGKIERYPAFGEAGEGWTRPAEPNEAAMPGWHVHESVHQALRGLTEEQAAVVQLAYSKVSRIPKSPHGSVFHWAQSRRACVWHSISCGYLWHPSKTRVV